MRQLLLISVIILQIFPGKGQTLGGNSIFNFLKLSNTPQLTGLGGINISNRTDDIGLVFNNPALLRPDMHLQTDIVFNLMYADIKNYHLLAGYTYEPYKINFAFGVNYFSYGNIPETDNAGNILGNFRATDYVVQAMASRQYGERWQYGAAIKFIHSSYGRFRSSGLAMDVGITYSDTANFIQASLLAKNMGAQLTTYQGAGADDLPFDLQVGISKKLAHAPLQFSFTAHHLHQFDIRYNDTAFNTENDFDLQTNGKKFTFDKLFRHIVLAAQWYISDKVEVSAGYNHLRRKELNIGAAGNGLNGFSLGMGVLLPKFNIRYARSYYQNNTAYNQFGLNLYLNGYFGAPGKGNRTGW